MRTTIKALPPKYMSALPASFPQTYIQRNITLKMPPTLSEPTPSNPVVTTFVRAIKTFLPFFLSASVYLENVLVVDKVGQMTLLFTEILPQGSRL